MTDRQRQKLDVLRGIRFAKVITEWERSFLENLANRPAEEPLREWQGAQLNVIYRSLCGGN